MGSDKIVIIGAGIAGLSAGCYALMNGYEALIFELHNRPGGVCTSWQRQGFTFDYCIHNLSGTGKGTDVSKLWSELRALAGTEIINHDTFVRVEGPKGEVLNLYADLSRLEKHLKDIAPEDARVIESYINAARSLIKVDLFALPMGGLKKKLDLLPHIPALIKWGKITVDGFAERFTNPFLRRAFSHLQYDIDGSELPMLIHLLFMAGLETGDLGWPRGGSQQFSKRIEKRFTNLGGRIFYNSPVERIIVRDDIAAGIVLADGRKESADIVISAADGYSTIYKLLSGKYTNNLIDSYYRAYPKKQDFGLQIFLGLNRDLAGEPHAITLLLDHPLKIERGERESLYLELFASSLGLATPGNSIIKAVTTGNYEYWQRLSASPEAYRAEKNKVAETVIDLLSNRFPGLKKQIDVVDVTTPLTAERFTRNFRGWQAWTPRVGAGKIMMGGLSKTLPRLHNFYMAGQWAGAMIGISTAAVTGRNTVRDICRQDGKCFITSI